MGIMQAVLVIADIVLLFIVQRETSDITVVLVATVLALTDCTKLMLTIHVLKELICRKEICMTEIATSMHRNRGMGVSKN
jgi:hypothetical protein